MVSVWNTRFLVDDVKQPWTKSTITDQGLDRVGDSYWISGTHIGSGKDSFSFKSTGVSKEVAYSDKSDKDISYVESDDTKITWTRELEYRFNLSDVSGVVSEVSLSWDEDKKTATAVGLLSGDVVLGEDEELIISWRVDVSEFLDDVYKGRVDFGASVHEYVLKPCFYSRFKNSYIGIPLTQKDGRVYSGVIPNDPSEEPQGSIDTNLANFDSYTFETRSKTFSNFFTLSSPNAVTRTATSHTIGLPSAYAIEFNPPIDKDFNRELTLNFKINWDRG